MEAKSAVTRSTILSPRAGLPATARPGRLPGDPGGDHPQLRARALGRRHRRAARPVPGHVRLRLPAGRRRPPLQVAVRGGPGDRDRVPGAGADPGGAVRRGVRAASRGGEAAGRRAVSRGTKAGFGWHGDRVPRPGRAPRAPGRSQAHALGSRPGAGPALSARGHAGRVAQPSQRGEGLRRLRGEGRRSHHARARVCRRRDTRRRHPPRATRAPARHRGPPAACGRARPCARERGRAPRRQARERVARVRTAR